MNTNKKLLDNDLIFNILDWFDEDQEDNDSDNDDNETDNNDKIIKKYVIKVFGRTLEGLSVCLKIYKFPPYFYILIPDEWINNLDYYVNRFINILKRKINIEYTLIKHEIVDRKKLYGFYANKTFKFIRLIFNNKKSMYNVIRFLNNKIFINNKSFQLDIYESNIEPILNIMHIKNILSCGWIQIPKDKLNIDIDNDTTCNINAKVEWEDIISLNINNIAPFYICSYDIECTSEDGSFPQANRDNDSIIQIGLVFSKYGTAEIIKKIIITLNTCDDIDNVIVIQCNNEIELLLKFQEIIQSEDPDILTGYNILSFDDSYIINRANKLKISEKFYFLSKLKYNKCELLTKNLSSAALGDNTLNYINTIGRVHIDLMKVIQRDFKLSSYKLDSVAEYFIKDKVNNIVKDNIYYKIYSNNINILAVGNYIRFEENNNILLTKYKIYDINYNDKWFCIDSIDEELLDNNTKIYWGLVKDDIKPNQIFSYFNKDAAHRKIIAEYCIQDCVLVSKLINKLEIITNNISMASVCYVPLSYIFFRGQGIKSLSLVAKTCKENKYLIPVLKKNDNQDDDGFEGATVFDAITGFYKQPIVVLDYNSLYPSSIISKNISHETLVELPEYDNLSDYDYYDIKYKDNNNNIIHCRYAKNKKKHGIIPTILIKLLSERKQTKKLMENETDIFKKNILDGKQLALKITANSIYGQLGASTSPIFFKHGAACTTAVGREMLELARNFVETKFVNIIQNIYNKLKNNDNDFIFDEYIREKNINYEIYLKKFIIELSDNYTIKPKIIYGDTDSIFININLKNKNNSNDNILNYSINLGKCISYFLKSLLPEPHNMEYEKTFYPFALMAKKKYIGNKYENDINNYKLTSVGVVLKRRDNANIVKKIIGKMVDIMMNEIDIDKTIKFIKQSIKDLLKGKYDISDFITTKILRGHYKGKKLTTTIIEDPKTKKEIIQGKKGDNGTWKWDDVECSQAHVCLCQRIKLRDSGNTPQINDRIPFVIIEKPLIKGKKFLQSEKIEHPEYIIENNLKIDYLFYLTNQIMNPSIQFLELIMNSEEAKKIFDSIIQKENNKKFGRVHVNKYIDLYKKDNISEFDDFINFTYEPIIVSKNKSKKK